jgi:DNA-directed RNA polymerase specialized sigma24 family protein
MKADDRPMVEAISRGSREAFVMLFDSTSGALRAELTSWLPDAERAVAVFAATYVEVWWLAGCHGRSDIDVTDWLRWILHRRITDVCRNGGPHPPPTTSNTGVDRWPGYAALELAALLGRSVERVWPA